jgi:hypothetical protein
MSKRRRETSKTEAKFHAEVKAREEQDKKYKTSPEYDAKTANTIERAKQAFVLIVVEKSEIGAYFTEWMNNAYVIERELAKIDHNPEMCEFTKDVDRARFIANLILSKPESKLISGFAIATKNLDEKNKFLEITYAIQQLINLQVAIYNNRNIDTYQRWYLDKWLEFLGCVPHSFMKLKSYFKLHEALEIITHNVITDLEHDTTLDIHPTVGVVNDYNQLASYTYIDDDESVDPFEYIHIGLNESGKPLASYEDMMDDAVYLLVNLLMKRTRAASKIADKLELFDVFLRARYLLTPGIVDNNTLKSSLQNFLEEPITSLYLYKSECL